MWTKAPAPKDLLDFARALQRKITPRLEVNGFVAEEIDPSPNQSGGWYVTLATHHRKDLAFDVWLDYYATPKGRRLSYCFSSFRAENIRALTQGGPRNQAVAFDRFDHDMVSDSKLECDRLRVELSPEEYSRPFYALHSGGEAYYGVYDPSPRPFGNGSTRTIAQATAFFTAIAPLASKKTEKVRDDQGSSGPSRKMAAEAAAADVSGRRRDPELVKAVDRHAMKKAKEELHRRGWESILDKSSTCSFDYLCQRNGRKPLRVEVKGTTSEGIALPVTANEVLIARKYHPHVALLVVHGIRADKTPSGYDTKGGIVRFFDRWQVNQSDLEPTAYLWWATKGRRPKRLPRDIETSR